MPKKLDDSNIQSDYLNSCFLDLHRKVKETVTKLLPCESRFEAIAVRGTSGLLVGPMVASILDKPWCIIRKPGDGTHSDHKVVEGWTGFKTYLIIDDLIATGGTIRLIQKTLADHARAYWEVWNSVTPECVGYYLFNHEELAWRGDGKTYSPYDKYFIFPEGPLRPSVSEQIAAAIAAGQNDLALAS
jgi:hypoxanthine phosphoribosyltransferase